MNRINPHRIEPSEQEESKYKQSEQEYKVSESKQSESKGGRSQSKIMTEKEEEIEDESNQKIGQSEVSLKNNTINSQKN